MSKVARQLNLSRDRAHLSFGQLAEATGYSKSTLHRTFVGKECRWEVVKAVTLACGDDPSEAESLWSAEHDKILSRIPVPSPDGINTAAELNSAMRLLLEISGMSLRQLESRGKFGSLPKSTVGKVLKERRLPRESLLKSFVRALGQGSQVAAWVEALHRASREESTGIRQSIPVSFTPSPRLLSVLADIPMSEVNCLAELIDNSLTAHVSAEAVARVLIDFEAGTENYRKSSVVIRDGGPGMDADTLRRSLAVGWAAKNSPERLGIGFNIATARLGSHITVRSARVNDPRWTVVTLDFAALEKSGEWTVPVWTEKKTETDDCGTQITVRGLREPWRRSNGKTIRAKLGDLYSYPLRTGKLHLEVNGRPVPARRPCIWAESRTVTYRKREINSLQRLDFPLAAAAICSNCRFANAVDADRCTECGGMQFYRAERRITGWLGIQRYVHGTGYGIDFLHGGRKILSQDKSLFIWKNLDGMEERLEYPVDGWRGGRIVGEVHCDHVPVTYTKDAFDYESAEWRQVVRAVRGDSPLSPMVARQYGYSINESPLAILFNGFRRVDPGLRYLVPGDGRGPIHDAAAKWGRAFHQGVPEYESDEIWYAAAKAHDSVVANGRGPSRGQLAAAENLDGDRSLNVLFGQQPPSPDLT
ncbi:XRE family transcriptional regulator [Streptomyces sp. NPDC005892]|uniref:XRE family transcriptional regulator n=1 Tax=Streptomyces sp. NPDC005892 TaxID=3155593 RepID=UPI0033CF737F